MSEIPEDIMEAARKVVIEDLGMDIAGTLQTSYIDCIAEAIEAERERSRTALSEAEQDMQEMRTLALEEAALWHDSQVQEYTDQIAVNDAYLARGGRLSSESRANEYCDDMRSCHRRSAAAIRALIPSEPHDAEVKPSWQDPSIFGDAEGRN